MQRDAYRKSLQETSKGRVQNWPNTMEAMRVKREEDRIKRLEDEEVSYETERSPNLFATSHKIQKSNN